MPFERQTTTGSFVVDGSTQVENVAALAALSTDDGTTVQLLGYAAPGDAGKPQNVIYHESGRPAADMFNIHGPEADDYWSFIDQDVADPRWAGAAFDGVTDDADALLAAIATGVPVELPAGTTRTTKQLALQGNTLFVGKGRAATIIIAEVADDFAIWVQSTSHSTVGGFALGNLTGSGIRHSVSHKSSIRDVWCGRGTRDIAFLNDGSQQLVYEGCYATTNSTQVISSSVIAKVGFGAIAYIQQGSTVASDPNLSGQTLELTFKAAATITISGNTLADVATSINAQSATTGIVAYIVNDQLYLMADPYDSDLGLDYDYDLVLADNTAAWSAVGFTAGTKTFSSTTAACPNASIWEDCHSEGMGVVGFMCDGAGARMSSGSEVPSSLKLDGCVFQGNGVTGGGTTSADVYLKDCINSRIDHHSEGTPTVANVVLENSHGNTLGGSTFGDVKLVNAKHNTFLNVNLLDGGELDSSSAFNTFIACSLNQLGTSKPGFKDLAVGNVYLNCQKSAVSSGSGYRIDATTTGHGQILNTNGSFKHWNAGNNLPVGYASSSGATFQKITAGTGQACRITSNGTSNSGLLFTVAEQTPVSGQFGEMITISFRARRLTSGALPKIGWNSSFWSYNTYASQTVDEAFPLDTWVRVNASLNFGSNKPNGWVLIQAGNTNGDQLEIDDLVIVRGNVAPHTYTEKAAEGEQAFIGGRWQDYGTAAPSSGRYSLAGSIRWRSDTSSGTNAGWICTVEGDPGTWVPFGPGYLVSLSADPVDPPNGHAISWISDGTASGDDGDVMQKITNSAGTTKTITRVDFSAF